MTNARLAGCLFLAAVACPFAARAEVVDGVAAVIGGSEIVTLSEVEERAGRGLPPADAKGDMRARREKMMKGAAEDLVSEHLLMKECADQGLQPTAPEVDNAIEDVQRANNVDRPTLLRALKEQGLSLDEYRDKLSKQLCQMKVVELRVKNRITITEDDIRNEYAKRTAGVKPIDEVHVLDIFVSSEGGADKARATIAAAQKRVEAGENFSKVAKETEGPLQSAAGDLGWLKPGDLSPQLAKVVPLLNPGAVSPVVETPEGFHLVKLADRRQRSGARTYAEMHDEIKRDLTSGKMESATEDYLVELRRNADVEYRFQ